MQNQDTEVLFYTREDTECKLHR